MHFPPFFVPLELYFFPNMIFGHIIGGLNQGSIILLLPPLRGGGGKKSKSRNQGREFKTYKEKEGLKGRRRKKMERKKEGKEEKRKKIKERTEKIS